MEPAWTSARLVLVAAQTAGPSSGAPGTARGAARLASILSTASARLVRLVLESAKHQIIKEDAPRAQVDTSSWTMDAIRQIDSRAARCVQQQIVMESAKRVLAVLIQMVMESAPRAQPNARSAVAQVLVLIASRGTTSLEQSASSAQLIAMRVAVLSRASPTA